MTDKHVTKGIKIVLCTIIILAGSLLGGLFDRAGHPLINGVIILTMCSVITAVWKHNPSRGTE